ncbi:acetolactate synthase 2 small subunit [Enterobacteriaceae endosymbiont of Plateumaris rustica]|uniref:acetolactate synthase 2 small subunit n=1 Tax=Enterobacteriaceae endosymbiont of Plateumaris rustica TaxID=2675796 RepID=UPI001449B12D|nr:acetolactate synthase 2 small subunit [Enterobacteriaceae endosymbiont of Plateumaris rustica]QJC29048.1 acetolactate synthase 2 small subunit [Enterobacteriaceae endosymbiont of Plateumaris rustica]
MNQYKIYINTYISPEIIERILRIIRHRGFRICYMKVNSILKIENIIFEIIVESKRPIDFLVKQLSKLIDVIDIKIF